MSTKTRKCLECSKDFEADTREINRGNAKFCSLSCGAIFRNKHQYKIYNHICKHCGVNFSSKTPYSIYCSDSCKQKSYRANSKAGKGSRKLLNDLGKLSCAICNYNKASRDIHHIIGVSKGGKTIITNLITLCPNCHREVHSNLISQDELSKLVKLRTISSSSNEEQDAMGSP